MQKDVQPTPSGKLDEFRLRDELRALRTQIPDSPALNPIVSLAFDLSRRLEAGDITFAELKALAGRLMDRACVQRARHLRERVGFVDRATTYKEFADFVESAAAAADFDSFKARWERARTGIVLTAHPTFGLSDALSKRIVEIAVADDVDPNTRIGVPHRPDENIDLAYEHGRAQNAIQNLRNAYVELLDSFFSAAASRFGDKAYSLRPKLATFACWVGYDLDGRNRHRLAQVVHPAPAGEASFARRYPRALSWPQERSPRRRRGTAAFPPGHRQARSHHRRCRRAGRSARQGDVVRYAARRGCQHHHPLGRLQHHDGRADCQPVTVAGRRPPGRQRQARRRRAGGTDGGNRSRHRAHPRAHQRRAAKQCLPRVRARAVDARSLGKPGAGAHRRHDRDGTQRDGQLRVARSRDGDGHPPVRAHRADPQARRSRNADPLPHRRNANLRRRC